MKKQAGFTLVEIAIVMVIIGLLLGGVLKGQEIITNARIKNLENDFNGITAAIYSYQDRYRALPGDDEYAKKRFGSSVTVSSDSSKKGNGKVDGLFDSTKDDDESRIFWTHLRYAGLVAGETDNFNQPLNAFNGKTGVSSENSGSTTPPDMSGVYIGFADIPVNVAIIVESRSDDQKPGKGGIQTDTNKADPDYTTLLNDKKTLNLYFAL